MRPALRPPVCTDLAGAPSRQGGEHLEAWRITSLFSSFEWFPISPSLLNCYISNDLCFKGNWRAVVYSESGSQLCRANLYLRARLLFPNWYHMPLSLLNALRIPGGTAAISESSRDSGVVCLTDVCPWVRPTASGPYRWGLAMRNGAVMGTALRHYLGWYGAHGSERPAAGDRHHVLLISFK